MQGAPPGDGAIRMRHRYRCHTKFPSSSPVWVRLLIFRLVPSLALSPDVLPSDA